MALCCTPERQPLRRVTVWRWIMAEVFRARGAVLIMLVLIVLALFFTWRMTGVFRGDIQAADTANKLAIGLRQTSDDLTRMARLNAVTGDPVYREYFDEILAIRNGEAPRPEQYFEIPYWDIVLSSGERPTAFGESVSLRELLGDVNLTDAELAQLVESEDQSNALTVLENEVMDSVAAWREAAGGVYLLEGEALDNMLRLHGAEYHAAKERIMRPQVAFGELAHERMTALSYALVGEVTQNTDLLAATIGLAVLLGVGVLLAYRK